MDSRVVGTMVVGLGVALAAAIAIPLATGSQPGYADLVPAPDTIIWSEGQESTVLVSTNLDDVDLRINSVAMGISNVQGAVPHSGELMVLGASVGCQDWAVSKLSATTTAAGYELHVDVDRDNFTGAADVFIRHRDVGTDEWIEYVPLRVSAGSDAGSQSYTSTTTQEVEASSDDNFPIALTRFITIDINAGTATTDEEVESIVLIKDTGVALKACSEHDDLMLTLHDGEEELNRYVVDIGPAATATPVPATPIPNPVFSPAYETLRFCPDAATPPDMQLDGGETVGTITATGTGTITYSLAPDGESRDFAFFEIDSAGAITVSDAGADDHTGINGSRLYTFLVRAIDSAGRVGEALVAVQVDLSNLAAAGDGVCP